MIEINDSDVKVPANFDDVYFKTCKVPSYSITKFNKLNLQLEQPVRDDLLKSGYIFVDGKDDDSIFLT